jgi:hypothetical protein
LHSVINTAHRVAPHRVLLAQCIASAPALPAVAREKSN